MATTRRGVLGKLLLGLSEGCILPAAFEIGTRPKLAAGEAAAGPGEVLHSLLYTPTPPSAKEIAHAELKNGEAALNAGEWKAAVEGLTKARDAAPREYKLSQRATLLRAKAHAALGNEAAASADRWAVWWWGRGLRFPGWYLVAYFSLRAAVADLLPAPEQQQGKQIYHGAGTGVGAATAKRLNLWELVAPVTFFGTYIFLLQTYGIVD